MRPQHAADSREYIGKLLNIFVSLHYFSTLGLKLNVSQSFI